MAVRWEGVGRRRASSDVAAHFIRQLIFEGNLRPGERVPQDDIAEALGVSRLPVREAIVALEQEGMVTTKPHRGTFVASIDERIIRDQYELYRVVFGFAAARAVERAPEGLLDRLHDIGGRLLASDDPAEIGDLSLAFDLTVFTASPRVKSIVRALPELRPSAFFALVPDAVAIRKQATVAILEAFERGDGTSAADHYGVMMYEIGERVIGLFRSQGFFS